VRNLPGFAWFLPIAALFHGQVINVSAIARDSGTAQTTVSGYLEILEDTLLAFRLPAIEPRLRVRERKHPKLYWVDPGLVRAVKRQLGPVAAEEKGPLVEGWVLTLLRAYAEENELFDAISYWSPAQSQGLEVDLLLRRGNEHLALEVKSSARFSRSWLKGLRAVGELHGVVRRVIVYAGSETLKTEEGVEVLASPGTALSTGAREVVAVITSHRWSDDAGPLRSARRSRPSSRSRRSSTAAPPG